jgi:hypothetical protein
MKLKLASLTAIAFVTLAAGLLHAAQTPQPQQPAAKPEVATNLSMTEIIDKAVQQEASLAARITKFHPLIETYIQNLDRDDELAFVPKNDQYFLGKLDLTAEGKERSLMPQQTWTKAIGSRISQIYSVRFLPNGFAQMLYINGGFKRSNYSFEYVRREFLGEVRCMVFDVKPIPHTDGTFAGRIWVEDQDYNIVRFNGTYGPSTATKLFFHFDSWRENMSPGLWLPAYIYTEESDASYLLGKVKLRFKGQTRLWGYNIRTSSQQNELTSLTVESDQVRDGANEANTVSPVRAYREWERQAEDNVIQRLEKAALIAPDGEVNKVLETVLSNLEITNNLDIQPEVRARVLLTSPLESFTIGHTIVLSRGLLDVLPDEASLAMILAHELAHIALGHRIDTKYAFNDRMLFDDAQAFKSVKMKRDDKEEIDADQKAAEYLEKSPYKDKLGNAGLFLRAVDERAGQLDHLLLPHIGNRMVKGSQVRRMADLMKSAPQLETGRVDQIAALPLGSRVRVDPWTSKIELIKTKPLTLMSAREKMPFEVTPVFLYLTRQSKTQTATKQ